MSSERPQPFWFLMELTYACPLQCPYCSNPVDFAKQKNELAKEDWLRVMKEARSMGATQLGFSGGEPLVRKDLEFLVQYGRHLGFYINLITSGIGLKRDRLQNLKDAGLDNIQISFQAARKDLNDHLAGMPAFEKKRQLAEEIKTQGLSLGLNFVLHRRNIDQIEDMMDMALQLKADYVELAHAQYYGFSLLNRDELLPTRAQIERAETQVRAYQSRYYGRIKYILVVPDYYENRPKACMNGWGKVFLLVTPDGTALPCHSARVIPNLCFPNVKEHSLAWIWNESPAFNAFRGFSWMKEPCRSCPERFKDFGGCRCQAFLLTGDPLNTDPACDLALHHSIVLDAIASAEQASSSEERSLIQRNLKNSRIFSSDQS